jgi:hypothetical protein
MPVKYYWSASYGNFLVTSGPQRLEESTSVVLLKPDEGGKPLRGAQELADAIA